MAMLYKVRVDNSADEAVVKAAVAEIREAVAGVKLTLTAGALLTELLDKTAEVRK